MTEWVQRWAGSYTFLSCDHWGRQYFEELRREFGVGFTRTVFVHRKGAVAFFVDKKELDALGERMAALTMDDARRAIALLEQLERNGAKLREIMDLLAGKVPSPQEHREFLDCYAKHLALHVFMKKTPDYLDARALARLGPQFRQARLATEAVYSDTERYFRALAATIGKKRRYAPDALTCLRQEELEAFLRDGTVPPKAMLLQRHEASALIFNEGTATILLGEAVAHLERELVPATQEVRGQCASPGVAVGRCRIVRDYRAPGDFQEGDVLVTGMTRPEWLPLVLKAAAIVTDVGGTLCHAALIARELGKPCIVGTGNATHALRDGEFIRVDANEGIVERLESGSQKG